MDEANETVFVNQIAASNHTIADGQGQGTILNDDAALPSLSINNVSVKEGNSGVTNAVFTVTLSAISGQTVTVNYATSDGSATISDNDYIAASGILTFAPGETKKTITIAVVGDI